MKEVEGLQRNHLVIFKPQADAVKFQKHVIFKLEIPNVETGAYQKVRFQYLLKQGKDLVLQMLVPALGYNTHTLLEVRRDYSLYLKLTEEKQSFIIKKNQDQKPPARYGVLM